MRLILEITKEIKTMRTRVEQLKNQAQINLYRREINVLEEELKKYPWYVISKEKRKVRRDLKTAIRVIKDELTRIGIND